MPKLSKKDTRRIKKFSNIIEKDEEYKELIIDNLQPLIKDIKRTNEFRLNLSYIILCEPFFDFRIILNTLLKIPKINIINIDIDEKILNNTINNYFMVVQNQIKNSSHKIKKPPCASGFSETPLIVINTFRAVIVNNYKNERAYIEQLRDFIDELARIPFDDNFIGFGIVNMIPEKIGDQHSPTFLKWEKYKKIIIDGQSTRVSVVKKIIDDYGKRERMPLMNMIDETNINSLINEAYGDYGLEPIKLLMKIKEIKKKALPKRVSKKDIKLFNEIISILSSSDKTRYTKLTSIRQELRKINYDARNILIDIINEQRKTIEFLFDTELKEKCSIESIPLDGKYPNYSTNIPEFGITMKIEVRSPYNNVYIDDVAIESKFPSGIIEIIKKKRNNLSRLKPTTFSDHDIIEIFISQIKLYSAANEKIIDINDFLAEVFSFLSSIHIYPISHDKKLSEIEYLKKKFSERLILEALMEYVTFETGKITDNRGILLDGLRNKLYTIMKLKGF